MADPIKVDSHVHLYPTAAAGLADKDGYEIIEYGERDEIAFSDFSGTLEDAKQAMEESGISKAVIVNLFISELHGGATGASPAKIADAMKTFNRWCCLVARDHPEFAAFVAADAIVLPGEAGAIHFRDMAENYGARGVKLHGIAQDFNMSDERLWPIYKVCQELDRPIIGHSGPDKNGTGFAEPKAFGRLLKDFPDLNVVLAHMGGASWDQALEIAETYPNAYFDCCEIIEWTGGSNAPTAEQLGQLIHDIGAHRVMMGSDFPWYDLDNTVDRIMDMPVLSNEEKEGILGANAVTILGL
jgi:hypothetical protein